MSSGVRRADSFLQPSIDTQRMLQLQIYNLTEFSNKIVSFCQILCYNIFHMET